MKREHRIFHVIRNFLFSSVNREFLVFLFFLALSGIFWLLMTLNESYEKEIKLPVQIVNVPQNVVLTSDSIDTIKVTLNDKGLMIMNYLYGERLKPLKINFKTYTRGNGSGSVSSAELQRLAYQQLSASTKIVSSKPDKLEFFYNYGLRKRVPVKWTGRVTPEHPYFISDVEYSPDSVDVFTSQERLDSINVVYTEPLNYANFHDTLSVRCYLHKQKGVKHVPDNIGVTFHTDVLTEARIANIPIKGINMPEGKVLRTFPAKITVRFVTGVNRYRKLSANDFSVVVDYNEIAKHPSDKCTLILRDAPEEISRVSLEMKQVDYLIEED